MTKGGKVQKKKLTKNDFVLLFIFFAWFCFVNVLYLIDLQILDK
jgi:hypothetical protein